MAKNINLHTAKRRKMDEFYTQYGDIEKEMAHYIPHFSGRTIYCNCDTPESNFIRYFEDHFEEYGLKRLIATGIDRNTGKGTLYDKSGEKEPYIGEINSGDFRSDECIEYLRQADIVVTNPPFSLFREYMALLFRYDKEFLIIGNKNAITYKEIFPLIKQNKIWVGYTPMCTDLLFDVPAEEAKILLAGKKPGSAYRIVNGVVKGRSQSIWFTNIPHAKRNLPLDFYKTYNDKDFPKYDNYNAIEVSKVSDIPMDYYGVMGVPITFLDKYCPAQFEIVGITDRGGDGFIDNLKIPNAERYDAPTVSGNGKYKRILIRRKSADK